MSYNEKGCAYYLRSLFYMITTTVDNYPLSINFQSSHFIGSFPY